MKIYICDATVTVNANYTRYRFGLLQKKVVACARRCCPQQARLSIYLFPNFFFSFFHPAVIFINFGVFNVYFFLLSLFLSLLRCLFPSIVKRCMQYADLLANAPYCQSAEIAKPLKQIYFTKKDVSFKHPVSVP